nr:hypothetical protein Itr_chr11CG11570 [Ipomoea trifida]GLL39356.1 hypothetical protein Itr_chr11CG11580 [Ipomoea trifida]
MMKCFAIRRRKNGGGYQPPLTGDQARRKRSRLPSLFAVSDRRLGAHHRWSGSVSLPKHYLFISFLFICRKMTKLRSSEVASVVDIMTKEVGRPE